MKNKNNVTTNLRKGIKRYGFRVLIWMELVLIMALSALFLVNIGVGSKTADKYPLLQESGLEATPLASVGNSRYEFRIYGSYGNYSLSYRTYGSGSYTYITSNSNMDSIIAQLFSIRGTENTTCAIHFAANADGSGTLNIGADYMDFGDTDYSGDIFITGSVTGAGYDIIHVTDDNTNLYINGNV